MVSTSDPSFEEANPYIAAATAKLGSRLGADGGGERKKLRKLVGYLDAEDATGTRRLYFTHELDCGVDIPVTDIVYGKRLPARRSDGLMRDFVFVGPGAALLFWSTQPLESTDPKGGNGFVAGPFS